MYVSYMSLASVRGLVGGHQSNWSILHGYLCLMSGYLFWQVVSLGPLPLLSPCTLGQQVIIYCPYYLDILLSMPPLIVLSPYCLT
jgi:hypothetical protein